jgi:hypothetical protein
MSAWARRIGWLLMTLALAVGWGGRSAGVTHYGPFPAVAVALLVGGIGVMLVVTDMMVRGLYAQVGTAAATSEAAAAGDAAVRPDGDDVAVGGDLDRA